MTSALDLKGYYDAERDAEVYAGSELALYDVKRFQRALSQFEDRLELVRAKPYSEELNPNQWYVRRRNDAVPDTFLPIPEPSYQVIDDLRARDLWGVDMRKMRSSQEQMRAAQRAAQTQERQEQMRERMDSLDRLSVRF